MYEAILVSIFGMGITLGAILLFWGLMWALTAIPLKSAEKPSAAQADSVMEDELRAQAAAVAVAMALAEQSLSAAHPLAEPPTSIVSAWQLGMRTRQMTDKGNVSFLKR